MFVATNIAYVHKTMGRYRFKNNFSLPLQMDKVSEKLGPAPLTPCRSPKPCLLLSSSRPPHVHCERGERRAILDGEMFSAQVEWSTGKVGSSSVSPSLSHTVSSQHNLAHSKVQQSGWAGAGKNKTKKTVDPQLLQQTTWLTSRQKISGYAELMKDFS